MTFFDSLVFVTKFTLGHFDLVAILIAVAGFLVSFLLIGRYWGSAWNRRWGFSGSGAQPVINLVVALVIALLLLQWKATSLSVIWLGQQRELIKQQITASGENNRQMFRKAWDKLQPLGGQEGLTPPAEGGNELRLNNDTEARMLAMAAAEAASPQLQTKDPFRYGAPLSIRDPASVAAETTSSGESSGAAYPMIVNPSNNWVRNALSAQASYAVDHAIAELKSPLASLENTLISVVVVLLLAQAILVAVRALADIKENPKV
ncbi:MAG: hypothetical protein JWO82_293 [Akkermansiaceae bacterium]|nr:hypothetical protein [Akkermansiaceae bacterium]